MQGARQPERGFGAIRPELQRPTIGEQGLVEVFLGQHRIAEVVVCIGMTGLEVEYLQQQRNGFVGPLQLDQYGAQIVQRLKVAGSKRQYLAVIGGGLLALLALAQNAAHVV